MSTSRPAAGRRARPMFIHPARGPHQPASLLRRIVMGLTVLVMVAVAGAGAFFYWSLHRAQSSSAATVVLHVREGDSTSTIGDRLQRMRMINNPLLFRVDARIHNLGATLKAGDYRLRRNMSIDQMVTSLQLYHSVTISVTIPEGLRIEQIAAILQQHGIDGRKFTAEAEHPRLSLPILSDKPAGASLEGYLYPDTYDVPPKFDGSKFADLMVRTLGKNYTPAMRADTARQGRTVFQVLTLASIVEREAAVASERPIIASVYLNRLRTHMVLDADPTVQYAVGTPSDWWPLLRVDQLHLDLPYNTYVRAGLPPGPIANPGLSSIKAVLRPARTRYYYFVAKGNGHHAFAETYHQQLENQSKYGKP